MTFISILFTILFIFLFIATLFLSTKKTTLNNISILIINIVTFIESFLLTRLFLHLAGNSFTKYFSTLLKKALDITKEEWPKANSLNEITKFTSFIIIGILLFILIFIILKVINHLLKNLILKFLPSSKKSAKKTKKTLTKNNHLILNCLISTVSFLIISFVFLFPFATINNICTKSIKKTTYQPKSYLKLLATNPVLKLYSNPVTITFFDTLTHTKNKDIPKNSTEIQGVISITLAVLDLQKDNFSNQNITLIKDKLTTTYLVSDFISELSSNAATRWKNNKPFMNETLAIPNNSSKVLYYDILDIVSNWKKEDFVEDIDTVFNIYEILYKRNIKSLDDSTALLEALAEDEFSEKLFLEVFHNDDFKSLIASFMNFGIIEVLKEANLPTTDEYISVESINELNDDDIKNEAHIFALTMQQINEIYNFDDDVTFDDFKRIARNLEEIKNSKLLTEAFYSILFEALESFM